jgi:hypothetical protein
MNGKGTKRGPKYQFKKPLKCLKKQITWKECKWKKLLRKGIKIRAK